MKLKTFKEYLRGLQESPDLIWTSKSGREFLEKQNDKIRNNHLQNRDKWKQIGEKENSNYHYEDDNHHHYFHIHNDKPREISMIRKSDNTHQVTSKGSAYNSDHIKKFMLHHLIKHGELRSDGTNSSGSQKLWIDLIKSNPKGVKFEAEHPDGNFELNHNNIEHHKSSIWGNSIKFNDIKIRATNVNR